MSNSATRSSTAAPRHSKMLEQSKFYMGEGVKNDVGRGLTLQPLVYQSINIGVIMSNLVVIGFDSESKAFELRAELAKLQKEYLIEMEDAVAVTSGQGHRWPLVQASLII